MSESLQNLNEQLDRLVDGELSSAEYKRLLAALDEQPEAWRSCALAFLEAQALGGELKVLRGECLEPTPQIADLPGKIGQESSRQRWRQPWFLGLAMAASFLLALPLGPLLWNLGGNAGTPVAVDVPRDRNVSPPDSPQIAATNNQQPLGNVRLVMNDNGEVVEVPIYHADRAGEILAADREESISPEMLRALEQAGHRVVREQSMLPFDTEDGGRVLVPVERYQIMPVANRVQ